MRNVFVPMQWQVPVWYDTSPRILLTGGAGGGKTHIGLEKIHAMAMRYPGSSYAICRKTLQSMYASTLPFFCNVVIKDVPGIRQNKVERIFRYPNGSAIYYFGMDDDKSAEKIRGIGSTGGLDGGLLEEANAFTEKDYNEVCGRLRGQTAPFIQLILCTNPGASSHWINQRLIDGKEASVYESKAIQNTYNPESYIKTLDQLTGVQRLRLRDGIWANADGAVFPEFDRKKHVVQRDYIPRGWQRYRAIDFGYVNSFVCLWGAIEPDTNALYIYRELHQTGLLVEDAAKIINQYSRGEDIIATIADHDAEGRATLQRYGISTIPAFKQITPGIEQLHTRLRNNKFYYVENALINYDQKLRDEHKPVDLPAEFECYVWAPTKDGKVAKEEPVKLNDHAIDALRYMVAHIDGITAESYGDINDVIKINSGPLQKSLNHVMPKTKFKF